MSIHHVARRAVIEHKQLQEVFNKKVENNGITISPATLNKRTTWETDIKLDMKSLFAKTDKSIFYIFEVR